MVKAKDEDNKRGTEKKVAKKASKKAGAKKSQSQATAAADTLAQPCLSLTAAAFIVGGCLPSGSHGNDDTLEETGLITPNLRLIFRECVFNGVRNANCDIDRSHIPNGKDTKVGEVIQAVFQNAR